MAWIGIISWDGYTYDDGEQPKDRERERERETARSKLKKPFWFFGIVAIFFLAICYVMINVFNREKSETEAIAHTQILWYEQDTRFCYSAENSLCVRFNDLFFFFFLLPSIYIASKLCQIFFFLVSLAMNESNLILSKNFYRGSIWFIFFLLFRRCTLYYWDGATNIRKKRRWTK